jgi:hypothetical protein
MHLSDTMIMQEYTGLTLGSGTFGRMEKSLIDFFNDDSPIGPFNKWGGMRGATPER